MEGGANMHLIGAMVFLVGASVACGVATGRVSWGAFVFCIGVFIVGLFLELANAIEDKL